MKSSGGKVIFDAATMFRFVSLIKKTSSCWLWQGALNRGYGTFQADKKLRLAHRISYAIFKGRLVNGLTIDHLCFNPRCVNPAHLEQVTIGVNVLRSHKAPPAINARKTHCMRGHPFNKENTAKIWSNGAWIRRCRPCYKYLQQRHRERVWARRAEK